MEEFERGLSLVSAGRYAEARACMERSSAAGCGAATFELAQAYDWLYYGTYWTAEQSLPRSYSLELLRKAAYEQELLPARAHLLTHEWEKLCIHAYDEKFGEGALELDCERDDYVRLRWICYDGMGRLRENVRIEHCLELFDVCVARNLPVPGDLGDTIASNGYQIMESFSAKIRQQALRGMAWAQYWMGIYVERQRKDYWLERAARNGHFKAAWSMHLHMHWRTQNIDMFECALYLDWYAAERRRTLKAEQGGLITLEHMRTRVITERTTAPLTPEEIYCFGRAAHRLDPNFEFWQKLGVSYRAFIARFRRRVIAFMHAAVQRGMPRDVARLIAREHLWPQRMQTATHDTYPVGLRGGGKRICYKE